MRSPQRNTASRPSKKAQAFGCDFYDTAEAYSPLLAGIGHNERILGKALKAVRKDVVIATKLHLSTEEVKAKGLYPTMKDHLTGSMERLQTDYVDLYYLHRFNPDIPIEEVAGTMGELEKEGLIRGWGLSQVGVDTIQKPRLSILSPPSRISTPWWSEAAKRK